MKQRGWLKLLYAVMIGLAFNQWAYSWTTAKTKSIPASATITPISILNVDVINMASGAVLSEAKIAFGTIDGEQAAWGTKPPDCIRISVRDNSFAWRIRTYTDNFTTTPATGTWGLQYGALIGSSPGAKIPLGWACMPDASANSTNGPPAGNPSSGTVNGWTYFKDARDVDDPSTANDESFAKSEEAGYCNIAFGTPGSTCVVKPNILLGNVPLPTQSTPFYMYLEGECSMAAASEYTGTIKIDLVNQ